MRKPASIHPWLSSEGLQSWVNEAHGREEHQRRLAVWLTHIGPFPAHQVATLLGVSKQAVWLWVGQYNRLGPEGLLRRGRGGRHWAYLTLAEEQAFLASLEARTRQGRIATAKQMHGDLCRRVGKKISLGYLYLLLHRHGWRKPEAAPRSRRTAKRSRS